MPIFMQKNPTFWSTKFIGLKIVLKKDDFKDPNNNSLRIPSPFLDGFRYFLDWVLAN
jgi:hypothetical protein